MRRRRHHRRRRNPGFFSGLLAPIKENGIGFAAGWAANHFLVDPLLMSFLPGSIVSPSKIVVGPLLGNVGKRFLPKFSRHWDALSLFIVAVGVKETIDGFMGTAPTPTKGFGWMPRRMGAIGPTGARGIGAIGPTAGVHGFGALSPSGETYEAYQTDGSY
jgi:hypothetical protein